MQYEVGWDVSGRRCVIDEDGKWVTNIPNNMSENEVLLRLGRGEKVFFDGRNQGMQNIPPAMVDVSTRPQVAPREDWPIYDEIFNLWYADIDDMDLRHTDEIFAEAKEVRDAGGDIDTVIYRYVPIPAWKKKAKAEKTN